MCGIFGIVATSDVFNRDYQRYYNAINTLFKLSETRGKEASGISVVTPDAIKSIKSPLAATTFIKNKEVKELIKDSFESSINGSLAFFGHSRLVTDGDRSDMENNQPVVTEDIVGVHNGIIVNPGDIEKKFGFTRKTAVDSEVIFKAIGTSIREGLMDIRSATSDLYGAYSIATAFADYDNVVLTTNNSSLYFYSFKGFVSFASEEAILRNFLASQGIKLDKKIERVTPFHVVNIEIGSKKIKVANSKEAHITLKPATKNRKLTWKAVGKTNLSTKSVLSDIAVSAEELKLIKTDLSAIDTLKRCTKCLIPETFPFVSFNKEGVCDFCLNHTPKEFLGKEALLNHVEQFRRTDGRPDCIVNMSGGRDSSYGLHYVKKELGLNPIAYTYDWGMVTDIARRNTSRICGSLGIENILISADIQKKRDNIKKNVSAWLKKPHLGMIPLFMAGDKQYFYYSMKLKQELGLSLTFTCGNYLEKTRFKSGFAGVPEVPKSKNGMWRTYDVGIKDKLSMLGFYGTQFLTNPSYLNSSLIDTAGAFFSSYMQKHDFCWLYEYIPWEEETLDSELKAHYDWETASDSDTTWRIGDGTSAFYNYIYLTMAGFNENDTFLSNKIREGMITREEALKTLKIQNEARFDTIKWYCSIIGIDFVAAIQSINNAKRLYKS